MSPSNLGIFSSQISGHLYANSYESIATQTVGAGGSSTVTFSSIPVGYTHLQVRYLGRGGYNNAGAGVNIYMTLNGDSGSNYSIHQLKGNGSGASVAGGANKTAIYPGLTIADAGCSANVFSSGIYDILDYKNTSKYKTVRLLNGFDNNGTGTAGFSSGLWMNTTAVNSITLTTDTGGWLQYSSFALYGVK